MLVQAIGIKMAELMFRLWLMLLIFLLLLRWSQIYSTLNMASYSKTTKKRDGPSES